MLQSLETNHNASGQREELKILITGDKPKNLLAGNPRSADLAYSKQMADALEEVSEQALNKIVKDNPNKKIVLLSGLELGIEQAAARRAVESEIEVRAFIPHKEHGKNWTLDNQKQYQELTREIVKNGGTVQNSDKEYSPQRTQLRDYRMVDESQIIISLHAPNNAPAHQKMLDYAAKHSKAILNIWTDAEKTLGEVSKNLDDKRAQNQTPAKLEIRKRITREDVRAEPDKIFLFGDNLKESGYGGQAKEMRGEANARGIPTKKEPANARTSFFNDKEFEANKNAIDEAFGKIPHGKTIVIPKAGIGTGLASLEEKAPQTFAYLNEKFAEIGFDNRRGKAIQLAPNNENKVVVQNSSERPAQAATRLLDLNNIQTNELKLLSPSQEEIDELQINRSEALSNYAERLRGNYKENRNGLRDGLRSVSDALDKGDQITVSCSCRNGEMCHADVVKMAIEKINLHIKNQQILETSRNAGKENAAQIVGQSTKTNSQKQEYKINPRTQRAITEILSVSETDKLLEKINQTDGRNQSEQASHLGKFSQFVRDVYERGGNVVGGNLIVPKETLTLSPPLLLTTQDYAVKRLGDILKDESKAKELAPTLIEHGNRVAGATADGETKLKVFVWMYDALEGKSEFLKSEASAQPAENKEQRFDNALAEISRLADEMHQLEPADKIEFAQLFDFEQNESLWEHADENRLVEEIYETAIGRDGGGEGEGGEREENLGNERSLEQDAGGKIAAEGFERIDLGNSVAPQLPADFTETETARLLAETLPEIDRQLESGISVKEILKPFHENVRQSGLMDALNRLEAVYQKQKISELETKLSNPNLPAAQKEKLESEVARWQSLVLTPSWDAQREILTGVRENEFKGKKTIAQISGKTGELSRSVKNQILEIDVRRQNVIELKLPSEFFAALGTAEKSFYQKIRNEDANLRLKLSEAKEKSDDKTKETELKKQLNDLRDLKPLFAYKLENSSEIIVGRASTNAMEMRAFASSYVNFQLKQPETRLRNENERYRIYAARLEAAGNRNDVIKTASDIRAENAARGLKWKDLNAAEKEKLSKPLTNREMQFLFTENSPAHYTPEMTVARLAYAHSGESRRQMTEALLKGEIKPSPEAQKLIASLESRLQRRELKDSMLATKHFFESLKTPNENLKFKNDSDHQEIYRQLPPQERDFVYQKTTRQKENLEYRLAFRQQELIKGETANRKPQPTLEQSKSEKSFHLLSQFNQARILGERIETSPLASLEIGEKDFRAAQVVLQNQPPEKTLKLGLELTQSNAVEDKKIGEILETFSNAEITKSDGKTNIEIKLPENSVLGTETYKELLEKFYPNDARENDKFKFANFNEKTLEDTRIKGQNETIKNWQSELGNSFYASDATAAQIFQTERALAEDVSRVAQMQQAARVARAENAQILGKYASRVAFKMQNQKSSVPSLAEQKQVIKVALDLSSKGAGFPVSSTNRQFFAVSQMEITVSDLQKFGSNEKVIAENQTSIRKTFSEVTVKQNALEASQIKPSEIRAEDKLADVYFKTQKTEENRLLTVAARRLKVSKG